MIIGVSILLKEGDQFIFELQKSSKWIRELDGTLAIGMGCIGGLIETSETPREALEREILEEIGCQVHLEEPTVPFSVTPNYDVEDVKGIDVPEGCHFVWEGDEPGFIRGAKVAVYVGSPIGQPRPGDLPGLISLDSNTLFECGQQSMKVEDVMAQGGRLIEREAIPRFAHLLPVGTTKVLIGLQAAGSESVEELLR